MDKILINLKGLGDQSLSLFSGNDLANDSFVHDVISEYVLHQYNNLPCNTIEETYRLNCFVNGVTPSEEQLKTWKVNTLGSIISVVNNEFDKLINPEDFVLRYTTDVNTYIFREEPAST